MVNRALSIIFATLVFAGAAFSQTNAGSSDAVLNETDLLSHEGQIVSLVELAGRPDLDTEQYRQLIPIHPGERLSRARILEAIDALRNTHRFDDVQVDFKPEFDGVRVAFILQPAFYVGLYQFPGAERFSYGLLIQISRFSAQEPLNSPYFFGAGAFNENLPELRAGPKRCFEVYVCQSISFVGPHLRVDTGLEITILSEVCQQRFLPLFNVNWGIRLLSGEAGDLNQNTIRKSLSTRELV